MEDTTSEMMNLLFRTMIIDKLLLEIHKEIQIAIYNDDGFDGGTGQRLLDEIERYVKVKRSHRDTSGLPES